MKVEEIFNKGNFIDTDKMRDTEAEFFEKMHELCLLAQKYNIPFFSLMFGSKDIMSQHFGLPTETKEVIDIRLNKWFSIINGHVLKLSRGNLSIQQVKKDGLNE